MKKSNRVEPLLRGHPDEMPAPQERPLDNVNLNINVLISTPDERPPLLKGHFSDSKVVASQEGFHCSHKCRKCTDSSDLSFYLIFFQYCVYCLVCNHGRSAFVNYKLPRWCGCLVLICY